MADTTPGVRPTTPLTPSQQQAQEVILRARAEAAQRARGAVTAAGQVPGLAPILPILLQNPELTREQLLRGAKPPVAAPPTPAAVAPAVAALPPPPARPVEFAAPQQKEAVILQLRLVERMAKDATLKSIVGNAILAIERDFTTGVRELANTVSELTKFTNPVGLIDRLEQSFGETALGFFRSFARSEFDESLDFADTVAGLQTAIDIANEPISKTRELLISARLQFPGENDAIGQLITLTLENLDTLGPKALVLLSSFVELVNDVPVVPVGEFQDRSTLIRLLAPKLSAQQLAELERTEIPLIPPQIAQAFIAAGAVPLLKKWKADGVPQVFIDPLSGRYSVGDAPKLLKLSPAKMQEVADKNAEILGLYSEMAANIPNGYARALYLTLLGARTRTVAEEVGILPLTPDIDDDLDWFVVRFDDGVGIAIEMFDLTLDQRRTVLMGFGLPAGPLLEQLIQITFTVGVDPTGQLVLTTIGKDFTDEQKKFIGDNADRPLKTTVIRKALGEIAPQTVAGRVARAGFNGIGNRWVTLLPDEKAKPLELLEPLEFLGEYLKANLSAEDIAKWKRTEELWGQIAAKQAEVAAIMNEAGAVGIALINYAAANRSILEVLNWLSDPPPVVSDLINAGMLKPGEVNDLLADNLTYVANLIDDVTKLASTAGTNAGFQILNKLDLQRTVEVQFIGQNFFKGPDGQPIKMTFAATAPGFFDALERPNQQMLDAEALTWLPLVRAGSLVTKGALRLTSGASKALLTRSLPKLIQTLTAQSTSAVRLAEGLALVGKQFSGAVQLAETLLVKVRINPFKILSPKSIVYETLRHMIRDEGVRGLENTLRLIGTWADVIGEQRTQSLIFEVLDVAAVGLGKRRFGFVYRLFQKFVELPFMSTDIAPGVRLFEGATLLDDIGRQVRAKFPGFAEAIDQRVVQFMIRNPEWASLTNASINATERAANTTYGKVPDFLPFPVPVE